MSIPFFTTKDYIIRAMGLFGLFGIYSLFRTRASREAAEPFAAAITGVKRGDRVLLSCGHDIALVTSAATTAGLTGRVVALAPTDAAAKQIANEVERAGGLVEPLGAPLNMLPLDSGTFDVAVLESTLLGLSEIDRRVALAELFRVLRPGGRLIWIEIQPRGGLFKVSAGSTKLLTTAERERMLAGAGFRAARVLAEAEGKTYLEGTKAAG